MAAPEQPPVRRHRGRQLISRTATRAWDDNIFSESAAAAFWQTLSLPPLLLGALGIFALGSVLAGAAGSLHELILARIVQGFGGGAILPLATAGASWMFSGPARPRALGAVSASNFLGMALGPFLGATVLEHFDLGPALAGAGYAGTTAFDLLVPAWRWVFYLAAPAAIVALGSEEINRIIQEEEKEYTEVVCHFCNEKYHFFPADMRRILEAAS